MPSGNAAVKYTVHTATPPAAAPSLVFTLVCLFTPACIAEDNKNIVCRNAIVAKEKPSGEGRSGRGTQWLLAAGCGCFSICFTLFTRRTAQRKLPGRSVYSFRFR